LDTLRKNDDKTATKEFVEKRSGERNVGSRIEVQLEEDGRRQHKTELEGGSGL